MNTSQTFSVATGGGEHPNSEPQFFQPVDIARRGQCCTMTIRRVADFLNLPRVTTGTGQRIFTRDQCRAILEELDRRKTECFR